MYSWPTDRGERVDFHLGSGRIVYDPERPGMKARTTYWCVVNTDNAIAAYYRWWVLRMYGVFLHQPAWGAHISVIRGEKPQDLSLWRKYQGETVHFAYAHDVKQTGGNRPDGTPRPDNFWFVEVECPRLIEIRKELDLPTRFRLHMTIGRTN